MDELTKEQQEAIEHARRKLERLYLTGSDYEFKRFEVSTVREHLRAAGYEFAASQAAEIMVEIGKIGDEYMGYEAMKRTVIHLLIDEQGQVKAYDHKAGKFVYGEPAFYVRVI